MENRYNDLTLSELRELLYAVQMEIIHMEEDEG